MLREGPTGKTIFLAQVLFLFFELRHERPIGKKWRVSSGSLFLFSQGKSEKQYIHVPTSFFRNGTTQNMLH